MLTHVYILFIYLDTTDAPAIGETLKSSRAMTTNRQDN